MAAIFLYYSLVFNLPIRLMQNIYQNTIPLSVVTKAAALDTYEDYTKVEALFAHWAVRGLGELETQIFRSASQRGTFPVHHSFKTVAIPLGLKRLTFCGYVDEFGYKYPLELKGEIIGQVKQHLETDRCNKCNQDLDICEKLEVTETKSVIDLADSTGTNSYTNTVTTYSEGDNLVIINKQYVLNVDKNLVEVVTTKDLVFLEKLDCGCIAPTVENINTIKNNCFSCYSTCYGDCRECNDDYGGYRMLEEVIQLDKNFPFDYVYLEFESAIPKKNGVYHVPEIAKEALIAYVKHKSTWNKRSVDLNVRVRDKQEYIEKKKNLSRILGRMKLSVIKESVYKMGKINIEQIHGCVPGSFGSTFISAINNQKSTVPQNIINIIQGGSSAIQALYEFEEINFTAITDITQYQNPLLIGAKALSFVLIDNQPMSDFTFNILTGTITFVGSTLFTGSKLIIPFNKKLQ